MSQTELAARSGLRREQLSRIESNQVPNVRKATIRKIAVALGKEPDYFDNRRAPYMVNIAKLDARVIKAIMECSADHGLTMDQAVEKIVLKCVELNQK